MLSPFNIVRTSVYAAVVVFTAICLAMAGHFQHFLATSDLTRFVPFSLFVCATSLFIITLLLGFSFFLKDRNPISTRIELSVLGLLGFFWFVLGIYLAKSTSQSANVECFDSPSSTDPLPDDASAFHTEQYQAMYRVLNSFAILNAILVAFFCLSLLVLAMRRQRKGDEHMWHGPVTSCAWFNSYGRASVKRGASGASSSSILPFTSSPSNEAKSRPVRRSRYTDRLTPAFPAHIRRTGRRGDREKPLPPPMRQSHSEGSSIIGSLSSNEFERGGMINPNAKRPRGRR